jgi:phosphate transport system protein
VRDRAALVLTAITRAGATLLAGDADARREIASGDAEADRRYQETERHGFDLVAQQGPVDGNLRLVTALLNPSLHLERTGDAAVNVATIAELIEGLPGARVPRPSRWVATFRRCADKSRFVSS